MRPSAFDELFSLDPRVACLPEGTLIYASGDRAEAAYVIVEGAIALLSRGRLVDVASRGSLIGERALLDRDPLRTTARAMTDVRLLPVSRDRVLELLRATPYFTTSLMRLMDDRVAPSR